MSCMTLFLHLLVWFFMYVTHFCLSIIHCFFLVLMSIKKKKNTVCPITVSIFSKIITDDVHVLFLFCVTEWTTVPGSVKLYILFPSCSQIFWMRSTACPPVKLCNKDNVRVWPWNFSSLGSFVWNASLGLQWTSELISQHVSWVQSILWNSAITLSPVTRDERSTLCKYQKSTVELRK